jgi:hypothetical protein
MRRKTLVRNRLTYGRLKLVIMQGSFVGSTRMINRKLTNGIAVAWHSFLCIALIGLGMLSLFLINRCSQVFDVTYTLPSGRKVRLRGKWDSADKTGDELWLQENKTKGRIDEQQILRQLKFDLQTMVYLIALKQEQLDSFWRRANKKWRDLPLAGVRYNVVRRPLSGGKGTIVRHKGTKNKPEESLESYYARLAQYIKDEPHTYFMRWNCRVGEEDIRRFKTESLDPILEQLCFWYDVVTKDGPDDPLPKYAINYRLPYFTFNPTLDGGITEYDEYLASGSMSMLEITHNLFPELTS